MHKSRCFTLCLWLLFASASLGAMDFGLGVSQNIGVTGIGGEADFNYTGTLAPWFAIPLDFSSPGFADIYVSGGFSFKYAHEEWSYIPEFYRAEAWLRPGIFDIRIGRTTYADPLGIVAVGLFDGASAQAVLGKAKVNAGVWYTGLLYKETAKIYMTDKERLAINRLLDYGNFWDTYAAPSRVLWSVGGSYPILPFLGLEGAFLGQIDCTGEDDTLHSEYLELKLQGRYVNLLDYSAGFAGELLQNAGNVQLSSAVLATVGLAIPGGPQDRVSLGLKWGMGAGKDDIASAFLPLTTVYQGSVLKSKLSGLVALEADYAIRPHRSVSGGLSMRYFFKTSEEVPEDSRAWGGEFSGSVLWSPLSDLSVMASGGIFVPAMGNFDPDGDPLWQLGLILILAF